MLRVLLPLLVCGAALASGVWLYTASQSADAAIESDNEIRATVARLKQQVDGLGGGDRGLNREIAAALIQWSDTIRAQGEQAEAFRETIIAQLSALEAGAGLPAPAAGLMVDVRLDALETQLDQLGQSAQTANDITAGLHERLGVLEAELERVAASASDTVIVPADFEQSIDKRLNTLETRLGDLARTAAATTGSATNLNASMTSLKHRLDRLAARMVTSADISVLLERNAETIRQALLTSTVAAAALPGPAGLPDQLVVPSESN